MDIISLTASKILTSDTNVSNYILIVDAYSKISKLYDMEKIKIEEIVDKLDMFQSRFGKIDEFRWWDLEKNQHMQVNNLPRQISKKNVKLAEFICH